MVSAGHVGGICGSRIVSSIYGVLEMSVERGMRGFGGVCVKCMCLVQGNVGGEGGVLDVCLGCCGVCEEWVGGLDQGLGEWVVLCLYEL